MNLLAIIISNLIILLVLYLIIIILINRKKAPKGTIIINNPEGIKDCLPQNIKLLTWNIGYAGLGEESDFFIDGGKNLLPPSKKIVQKNLLAIESELTQIKADIFLLQEVSHNSLLSRHVGVLAQIIKNFPKYFILFRPDIASWGIPYPLKIFHGTLTLAKTKPQQTMLKTLPFEEKPLAGIFKRHYALQINYFPIKGKEKNWVIINLHLAAFDEDGITRQQQFDVIFAFAQQEYEKGNYVVLGGDWNMELEKSNFPHQTPEKYLFWKVLFPKERLPKGWQIAIDKSSPTVRSNHQPYMEGENYTAIIDGYVISPNIKINEIETLNSKFKYTDHLPIIASFSTN